MTTLYEGDPRPVVGTLVLGGSLTRFTAAHHPECRRLLDGQIGGLSALARESPGIVAHLRRLPRAEGRGAPARVTSAPPRRREEIYAAVEVCRFAARRQRPTAVRTAATKSVVDVGFSRTASNPMPHSSSCASARPVKRTTAHAGDHRLTCSRIKRPPRVSERSSRSVTIASGTPFSKSACASPRLAASNTTAPSSSRMARTTSRR